MHDESQSSADRTGIDSRESCRELVTDAEWVLGWEALRTLRPRLSREDFLTRKTQLTRNGYHLVGLYRDGIVVSVASYTISPHAVFEREMIIHDMSTLAGQESKGYGTELLAYLDRRALEVNCGRTIVATAKAANFYESNGYLAHATALKKIHNRG